MAIPPSSITDGSAFQLLTESIASDMQSLTFHWRLYQDLRDSVSDYEVELNQAKAFWNLTFEAHRDASLFRLCRLYDQHKSALNLKNWLNALRKNPEFFQSPKSKPCSATLDADIKSVSESDGIAKKIICLRNNLLAHRVLKPITSQDGTLIHLKIPTASVTILVERAQNLVNRYTTLLNRESYSTTILGHKDYISVLESVRSKLQQTDS